jgi:hypothetical protein
MGLNIMAKTKGILEAFIEAEVRDKNGKLIEKRRFRSRSFVANLLRLLRQLMIRYSTAGTSGSFYHGGTSSEPIDHTGSAKPIWLYTANANTVHNWLLAGAIDGEDSFGIRVGRGTSTPTPTDYNLEIPITHGTGVNQLSYGTVTIDTLNISGNTVTLRIIRTLTNNSGSAITVSEIGISVRIKTSYTDTWAYILIARDLVSPPVSVPVGSTLTIRYLLQTTV